MVILRSAITLFVAGLLVGCGSSGDSGSSKDGNSDAGAGGVDGDAGGNGTGATSSSGGSGTGASNGAGGSGTSGAGGTNGAGGNGTSGAGAGGSGSGAGGSGSGGGGTGGPVTSVTPVSDVNACAVDKVQAQGDVLDVFIMEDRSGSMEDLTSSGDSKWTVITSALSSFVSDPQSAGIGAGIGFFGDSGNDSNSCDPATYATPVVPIDTLNGNAAAITRAIQSINTGGNTPTEPALEGALDYAQAWASQHPTHKVIVIFATDGLPNGCNSSVQGSADVAAAGLSDSPSVPTYVIGVFGSEDCPNGLTTACDVVQNTNTIAKAGGTGSAFIVDTGGNTLQQFENAMSAIRTANTVACQYTIPPAPSGKTIDPTRATVQYATAGQTPTNLTWRATAADCQGADGWYYDDVNAPGKIHLCDATCQTVQADPQAAIELLLACNESGYGGGGATGAGGTTGAGGSGYAGGPACLLDGQSCQSGSECCGGICSSGVCGLIQ